MMNVLLNYLCLKEQTTICLIDLMDRLYNQINVHLIDVIEDYSDINASVKRRYT